MTYIAMVSDGITVCIGGDSAGVRGMHLSLRRDERIFVRLDEEGNK